MRSMPNESSAKMDLSFPVEVGDGRRLQISWNTGDNPKEVAAKFAAQHGIASDEVPSIVSFIQHASTVSGNTQDMDVSDTTPSAPPPPYSGASEEQLQALEAMGFPNRELNMQLLVAHNGDMQRVLEQLI